MKPCVHQKKKPLFINHIPIFSMVNPPWFYGQNSNHQAGVLNLFIFVGPRNLMFFPVIPLAWTIMDRGDCSAWLHNFTTISYGGVHKWGYLQIIHFTGIFPHKPTILRYPHDYGNRHIYIFIYIYMYTYGYIYIYPCCIAIVSSIVSAEFSPIHPVLPSYPIAKPRWIGSTTSRNHRGEV